MIGKLKGIIDSCGEDWAIIDVSGVGYHVICSGKTLAALPGVGEIVTLSIETHVREDQIALFGFASPIEREWFRLLQTVQGVGTRVALAILSTFAPSDLAGAIAMQDRAMISRAQGVGARVAQRIISELKDKGPALALANGGISGVQGSGTEQSPSIMSDAVSALTNLGYGHLQASQAAMAALDTAGRDATTADLIPLALRELTK
ncbi:MAG: Holliday junction branch migration protein RuvA [Hyphomicrobiales bacterium]